MLNCRQSFPISRNGGSFAAETTGRSAAALIRNLCLASFVVAILICTLIGAKYQPEDPWFQPPTVIGKLFRSNSSAGGGATFAALAVNISDSESDSDPTAADSGNCKTDDPIACDNFDVFLLLMRSAMAAFTDIHFHRFGKPVQGENPSSCHMAWQFRPKAEQNANGNATALDKDYRAFTVLRSENCSITVAAIGDYRSGGNARSRKKAVGDRHIENSMITSEALISEVESEESFSRGKYLIYSGGGDRCKDMSQYLWSFMCMLGEALYLNRTLVMDLRVCLSKAHSPSGEDEDGKDWRFYFDFERLMDSAQVMEESQFWREWRRNDGLSLRFVEDFAVAPSKLAEVEDALIMRKFGSDNYWYQVCEGDGGSVVARPWRKLWKSRQLLDISYAIIARMKWDYVSVNVERGMKARNKELWPNLDRDTSPDSLLSKLKDRVGEGANVYITTNEPNVSFFDPLKEKYSVHFVDEYNDLWNAESDWFDEMRKLNQGDAVEFDSYMKASVDMEVFLRSKMSIQTFNDLTGDCKDGVNTCTSPT
ncbi:uncharacterized protein LOC127266103 [Andrographis paniculata]|uniref:uncharacterized protein LOC127266103 n=1 Tax=Andrographis paniculata TaxID=175694 RepID=UPI0021E92530|nr:uncharacterized protein LOC127266103 [Andrographis paniculata]